MRWFKNILKKVFSDFYWFFTFLRYKIFLGIFISILVGVLDGFGLTMFLPLLKLVSGSGEEVAEGMGNLSFLIDFFNGIGLTVTLNTVLLLMIVFFVFKAFAKYGGKIYNVILLQGLMRKLRLTTMNYFSKLSYKFFVTSDVGRIQNVMTGEVDRIQQAYMFYFSAVEQFILVLVYTTFAFIIDFQFALLVTVGGVLTNLMYSSVYKSTKGASKKLSMGTNTYQGYVIQYVTNFKYLKSTGMESVYSKKIEGIIFSLEGLRKRIGFLGAILDSAREPMLVAVVAAVIYLQVSVFGGQLGAILISLLFFYKTLGAVTSMQNTWNRFLSVSGTMDNVQDLLKELKTNNFKDGALPFNGLQSEIKVEDVIFNYGDTTILNDISLCIPKNQSIAFVGESGSGKTTLVNIISGLLAPTNGNIMLDGVSLESIRKVEYQRKIGYITQESVIFNDTIFNNVTFWAEQNEENVAKCIEALKRASIYDFVQQLPERLETLLGNNGVNLSGGQKQRISIARELYKDIEIMILDEATSALDSETEKAIQQSIDSFKGQYTILIVAHRLSTIQNVDRVVYMKNGRIEAQGSFDELKQTHRDFARLVELQEI